MQCKATIFLKFQNCLFLFSFCYSAWQGKPLSADACSTPLRSEEMQEMPKFCKNQAEVNATTICWASFLIHTKNYDVTIKILLVPGIKPLWYKFWTDVKNTAKPKTTENISNPSIAEWVNADFQWWLVQGGFIAVPQISDFCSSTAMFLKWNDLQNSPATLQLPQLMHSCWKLVLSISVYWGRRSRYFKGQTGT